MKKELTRSQSLVLETLNGEEALTYEEVAAETGLSYDGVRGRVSELSKLGYSIERTKDEGHTFLMYRGKDVNKSSYKRPNDIKDGIATKIKAVKDFYGITDFLDSIKTQKIKKQKVMEKEEEENHAVLLLSDLHFGELIFDQTNDALLYDTATANQRMDDLAQEVIIKLEQEEIEHITILGLGDIVDGDSIYRNHLFRIEKPAIEQVQDSVKALSEFIRRISANNITVEMHNVRGNHGITNYKNLEEDNWDSVVYDMLEIVFMENDSVVINNFKNSEGCVEVGGRRIVLYHGEKFGPQIKTASGLREFRGMCGKHGLDTGDIIVVGHLHEFGVEIDQGKFLVRNGSLADSSEYAFKLNLYSEPMQTLMIFNEYENYPRFIPISLE